MKRSGLPKWQQLLTAGERRHMRDDATDGRVTLAGMRRNFAFHARMRAAHPDPEPCWDCRRIARKLQEAGRL